MAGAVDLLCSSTNRFGKEYRQYDGAAEEWGTRVQTTYALNHEKQTYEFVCQQEAKHCLLNKHKMGIWQALELLEEVTDDSDPDTSLPQLQHLFQTAEAARAAHPEADFLHLAALLHDIGKVLAHPAFGGEPQWATVGDTFPVGCAFHPSVVRSDLFAANPDAANPAYATPCGIYSPGCGLRSVQMSWGHDEYAYRVLSHPPNGCSLPPAALFVVRYHSFYALHSPPAGSPPGGGYAHLLDDFDRENLTWLVAFQKFDLYSKGAAPVDIPAVSDYYKGLIAKYFSSDVLEW